MDTGTGTPGMYDTTQNNNPVETNDDDTVRKCGFKAIGTASQQAASTHFYQCANTVIPF